MVKILPVSNAHMLLILINGSPVNFILKLSQSPLSAGLLNSPNKARTQDVQIDTGIINWGNESSAITNNKGTYKSYCFFK